MATFKLKSISLVSYYFAQFLSQLIEIIVMIDGKNHKTERPSTLEDGDSDWNDSQHIDLSC